MTENRFEDDIWELLRTTFVEEEYYINDKTQPAFLLSWTDPKKWQLLVNHLGIIGTFPNRAKARAKLKDIIENANVPVVVWRYSKHHKKLLFAKNDVTRIELKGENPFRVFNFKFAEENP